SSLAAYLQFELFRVFTRRISNRSVVGCIRLLESHTYVCSSRYPRWPHLVPKVAQVKVFGA
ncbi:hypothetical protein, partial [Providencia rettgeri]|uniref:hypothetical protein n=1 Tax=Providencia rettgeri TaxID=587 RepID=UPI001EF64A5F